MQERRLYTPQEISAMILQKMKKTAEDYLGQEVTEAVITVNSCTSQLMITWSKSSPPK